MRACKGEAPGTLSVQRRMLHALTFYQGAGLVEGQDPEHWVLGAGQGASAAWVLPCWLIVCTSAAG